MINRWELKDEVREKYFDKVENTLKNGGILDLSDTELNPAMLQCMLEGFGFQDASADVGGWEMDFEIEMYNEGEDDDYISYVEIKGCGMTFELKLCSLGE